MSISCPSFSKHLHVSLCAWSITFKTKATVVAQDQMAAHDPDMRGLLTTVKVTSSSSTWHLFQRGSEFVLVISSFINQT